MPINIWDDGDALVLEASLPGARPEEVEVSGADGVLTIRAVVGVPEHPYLHQEMFGLEYLRQIALPADCRLEAADARVDQGMLTVRVPKSRPHVPEPIRIQVNRKGPASTTIEAEPGSGYEVIRGDTLKPRTRAPRRPRSGSAD